VRIQTYPIHPLKKRGIDQTQEEHLINSLENPKPGFFFFNPGRCYFDVQALKKFHTISLHLKSLHTRPAINFGRYYPPPGKVGPPPKSRIITTSYLFADLLNRALHIYIFVLSSSMRIFQ